MADPLPVKALHHVGITTQSLAESIAFYTDVLGFRAIERPEFDFKGAWLFGLGFQIHIIERPDLAAASASDEIDTKALHLALAVADVEVHAGVEQRLKEMGIRYVNQVNAGGIPQIFFQDPDGRHIEIGVYPPAPPFVS
jgi:glyoxylase I family protein